MKRIDTTGGAHAMKPDEIVLDSMGFLIPPGEEGLITSPRQKVRFQCQRFVVPTAIAPHFHVVDFKIGNHSIFVGWAPDGIPAAQNIDVELMKIARIVQYMMDVMIRVRNTSDQPRVFHATIHGVPWETPGR